jgi:hypothetical protein
MKRRSSKGQSMVEYAIGIGAVSACCMVALGSLGHISGDIFQSVQNAITYGGARPADPGRMINNSATPWSID